VIGVGIPPGPVLVLPILPPLVLFPEFLDAFPNLLRRPDLLEPELGVILHAPRLPKRHLDAILLGALANRERARSAVVILARLYHPVVLGPPVPEVLHRHAGVLGGGGIIRGIDVVREPGVIVGYGNVMDREGDVHAIRRLAEEIDLLSRLGLGVHLVIIAPGGGRCGVLLVGHGDVARLLPPQGGGGRGEERNAEGRGCPGGGGRCSSPPHC
jgi:hypothetical protein